LLVQYDRALSVLEIVAEARERADPCQKEVHPLGTPPSNASNHRRFDLCEVEVYRSEEEASRAVLREVLVASKHAMKERGRFVLVIPGGRTFLPVSRLLAEEFTAAPLGGWQIFLTDEHMARAEEGMFPNARAALQDGGWQDLISQGRLGPSQFHTMSLEVRPAHAPSLRALRSLANRYEAEYKAALAGQPGADLLIAGIGKDAHTASILPQQTSWRNPLHFARRHFAEVRYPETYSLASPERVSITLRGLQTAGRVILFCLGSDKASAVRRALLELVDAAAVPSTFARTRPTRFICDAPSADGIREPGQPGLERS